MKALLFILAWVSFVLGIIGAFLPVLPTTPFLILSAFLFSKSSPRFHSWLLSLPVAGEAIRDWNQNHVIRPRAKVLCAVMIIVSLASLWAFADTPVVLNFLLTVLLTAVMIFVLTRPSGNLP